MIRTVAPRKKAIYEKPTYEYQPIENYGVIGDLHTVALVGLNGSIDWCCLPHFDSPSVFGAILDKNKGGRWQITAKQPAIHKQLYFPDTNVLVTRFLSEEGVGEVIDFMPVAEDLAHSSVVKSHSIIRRVTVVRGKMAFSMFCQPAFNYGRDPHTLHLVDGGALLSSRALTLGLVSSVPLSRSDGNLTAEFTLEAGTGTTFILRQEDGVDDAKLIRQPSENEESVDTTIMRWKRWISQCQYRGRWREAVNRSALALKLMTFAPTGAIVAAPTCSLPETVGGPLNWDYRYTWIRDASFTIYALLRIGFRREAHSFMEWVEARLREAGKVGKLQIMYGLHGEHKLTETLLSHWEGYRGSGPVRIGNAAYDQLQLDIYGEMMDAVDVFDRDATPISADLWQNIRNIMDWMIKHWRDPDEGIWEARSGRLQNTHSKVMCWVALDRALRIAARRSLPVDRPLWEKQRDAIYESIRQKAWNPKRGAFTQSYGSPSLDASSLLMPLVNFMSPTDPLIVSTLKAINQDLISDSLVYRYQIGGTEVGEGTFSICTFWLVEALARAGRPETARLIFEKMLGYANHLGLYAEEIGRSGEALGNFPQAFTHLGLINSAWILDRALDGHKND
ncbi:MAG TPA: glycoside hydrolase family 15 protein [Fibrobacteria bacterium]|nr:glycoside hydrolase family 15 protein [Fibrobacteria bacterium]